MGQEMPENVVFVLTSKIMEERLPAIVAKRPLFPFFRRISNIIGFRKIYYPYWCISLEATAAQKFRRDQTLKLLVTVDGMTGDVGYAKSIPDGAEAREESLRDRMKVKVTQNEAWEKAKDFALRLFMRKVFFLKEVLSEIKETRLVYYPYWIVEVQKNHERFRRVVDAIHGEFNDRIIHLLEK